MFSAFYIFFGWFSFCMGVVNLARAIYKNVHYQDGDISFKSKQYLIAQSALSGLYFTTWQVLISLR